MNLIYVECKYLHPETFAIIGELVKEPMSQAEFNGWYRAAKLDTHCVINVMKYNPKDNPEQNQRLYAELLSVRHNLETGN